MNYLKCMKYLKIFEIYDNMRNIQMYVSLLSQDLCMIFSSESANVTYEVLKASSFSEGLYRCNASNSEGWGTAETLLDVKGKRKTAKCKKNFKIIVVKSRSTAFSVAIMQYLI